MSITIWQGLGAFVDTGSNLRDDQLRRFGGIGGRWIAPVLLGDEAAGPWNRENIETLKERATRCGVRTGGWFNGFGGDVEADAQAFAAFAKQHYLQPVILDLETAYQGGAAAALMPELVQRVRKLLTPTWPLAVSTNGLNNASIWNGRTLTPPRSFYDLGVRVLPQWYSGYYRQDGATSPQETMRRLRDTGGTDFNFKSVTAPGSRGVPLSYIHGTFEATGHEGSDVATELADLHAAKAYGYTVGCSLYALELTEEPDFAEIAKRRGALYL